jgi:hypothetical protein
MVSAALRAAIFAAQAFNILLESAPIEFGAVEGERGGRPDIQESSVSRSGAAPRDSTRFAGSAAAILSMTVKRVSIVVPWRA